MITAELLKELCEIPGPSGFESRVTVRIKSILDKCMDKAWIDTMGNVIGVKRCGKDGARKLLLDAHIDEIGMIVIGVEEGFLRFAKLGRLDERTLPASGVEILTEPSRYGVISVLPPHILKKEDSEKLIKVEDLFVDTGLTQEEALTAIPLGTPCVLSRGIRRFGNNLLSGKALDGRACFAAILSALELLEDIELDVDLYVMASVQEEVGVRGASPGVFAIAPDYAVVIDVVHAKTPDTKPFEALTELGGGAVVSRGPNMNVSITEKVIKLAVDNKIKHQITVTPSGESGTNARVIQISREGVATAVLGVPMRYMHGSFEVVSLDDIENTARLICETAKAIEGGAL